MRLAGKVALITGAAAGVEGQLMGFGGAAARLFAREGARVVLTDIKEEIGFKTAEQIRAYGGEDVFVRHDVTSEEEWQEVIQTTIATFGKLNVLVNNAGTGARFTVEETTVAVWDAQMDVHAKGVFLGTKYAIPEMRKAGGGSIVNISSVAGIGQSLHQEPAYAASKGAIRIFTKVTASQHAKDKIRCNSVHPGPIDTEMLHSAMPDPEVLRRRMERVPLGRMRTVDEVVKLVLDLASDDSAYISGSELVIDGGALAQ